MRLNKMLLFLFIVLFTNIVFSQKTLEIREKIIPLKTSRLQVEKAVKFVKKFSDFTRYETENETIDVKFAKVKCIGSGWNVSSDTVLSYKTYPKSRLKLGDVWNQTINYFEIGDDIGNTYLIDSTNGVEFVIDAKEHKKIQPSKEIKYIGFYPDEKDKILRCEGFPKYNLISEHYVPLEEISNKNANNWGVAELLDVFFKVETETSKKGYIFVYCQQNHLYECNQIKKKIETASKIYMKKNLKRLTISIGGYRQGTEVETFLLPIDYPSAIARPHYPSKF